MSKAELCRALIEYNVATWERVWDSVATLPPERFTAPVDYSHGSLRDQLVHVTTVEEGWRRGLEGDPNARSYRVDPADAATVADLRRLWRGAADRWLAYAAALDDARLEETLPGMAGPTWQVVAHVMNHGTDHRAQVLRVLHDFGAPTFDQDAIYHFWFRDRTG